MYIYYINIDIRIYHIYVHLYIRIFFDLYVIYTYNTMYICTYIITDITYHKFTHTLISPHISP